MPRSKSRGKKPQQKNQSVPRQIPEPPPKLPKIVARIAKLIGLVVAGLGFAATVVTFLPRPVIEQRGGDDSVGEISTVSFTVRNGGYLWLRNARVMLGLCYIKTTRGPTFEGASCANGFATKITLGNLRADLGMDDPAQPLTMPDYFRFPIESADIGILVSYNPWFLPWQRTKPYRYRARTMDDGKVHWEPIPVETNPP